MAGISALFERYAGELRCYTNDSERYTKTEKIKPRDADNQGESRGVLHKVVSDQKHRVDKIFESFLAILLQQAPQKATELKEIASDYSPGDPELDFSEGVAKAIKSLENLTSDQLRTIGEVIDSLLAINQNKGRDSLDKGQLLYVDVDSICNTIKNLTEPTEIEKKIAKAMEGVIRGPDESFSCLFAELHKKKQYNQIARLCVHLFRNGKKRVAFLVPMFDSIIKLGVGMFREEEFAVWYANELLDDWDEEFYGVYIEYLVNRLKAGGDKQKVREEMLKTTIRCKERFPLIECGYYGEAFMYCAINKPDAEKEANDILLSAVFEKALPLEPNRKPVYIECPHCCKLLLEKMGSWLDSELVDRACEKGLRDSKNKHKDMYRYFQKYQKNLRAQSVPVK